MHVCMLLEGGYPPDIRVTKEATALVAAGHRVTVLCERDAAEPADESRDGIEIRRRRLREAPDGVAGIVRGAKFLASYVRRPCVSGIEDLHVTDPIDVLHVHDLPLGRSALEASERLDLPVVLDLHENWPEAVRQYRGTDTWRRYVETPSYLAGRIAMPIARWKRIERDCVQRADRVITVAEEAKRHYVEDCGADPSDVVVVSNVVDLERFDRDVEPATVDGEFVLSYVGTLGGRHRGIETVLRAMPSLLETIPEAHFLVVGAGAAYEDECRALVSELGLEEQVAFTGWVDFEQIPGYVAASDVCLVTHRSTGHTETTVPHKLSQYMAMGKPVIVTDVGPLERIISESNAGLVVPDGDSDALAREAIELHQRPNFAAELGSNGRQAVEERYNWERGSASLTAMYDELARAECDSTGYRDAEHYRSPEASM
ncbi:glycosyltransferase family 4 protein [Salinirubellus salinus]